MSDTEFDVPLALRRGARRQDQGSYVDKGGVLLDTIRDCLGLDGLEGKALLDMGCGTRITQALHRGGHTLRHYTGIDINAALIEHLQQSVKLANMDFHHLDIHNAMYNPGGSPLAELSALPVPAAHYDVISLFSVFTHLNPQDYVSMLKLLRPHVTDGGRLLFSLFVNETTSGGHGYIDALTRSLAESPELINEDLLREGTAREVPDFIDEVPGKPLLRAIYSRAYALALLANTGWELEHLHDPRPQVQHVMVCRPV